MQTIFTTPRLTIRPLNRQDLPEVAEMLSDPAVMQHSVNGVYDRQASLKFIQWCQDCYRNHGMGPWALIETSSSAFVGFCGIAPETVNDRKEINLGYRLAKRFWGKGLATEAVKATLKYGLTEKRLASIVVIIEPDHIASLRVAEKAGFCQYEEVIFHQKSVRLYRMEPEFAQ